MDEYFFAGSLGDLARVKSLGRSTRLRE